MVLPALNEAVACVREGIVADADLCDAGVIFGTGFAPHRGGPISDHPRARQGVVAARRWRSCEAKHGERFVPDTGWDTL